MCGWLASRGLEEALATSPCGCDALDKAPTRARVERESLEQRGPELQEAWQCPAAGYPQASSINELPRRQQETLEKVQSLIDSKLPPTCPLACTRRSWVATALKAWRAFEKGQLESIYGEPSCVMMEAVDLISIGIAKKTQWDIDHPKTDSK